MNIFKKRTSLKRLFGVIIILASLFVLTGCSTLETLIQEDGTVTTLGEWTGSEGTGVPTLSNPSEGRTIVLYFPDSSGEYLVAEERVIPKTLSLARETTKQWLMGPATVGNAQPAVSLETVLLDIGIKEGIATVDLSREFIQPWGQVSQEAALYGLVNTLTQFSTVNEVKIRVEGKELDNLGSIDTTHLVYNGSLVKESNSLGSLPEATSSSKTEETNLNGLPASSDSPSAIDLFSFPPTTI